jgi:3-phosphoshikimate 1-carboxyvinyltransferase
VTRAVPGTVRVHPGRPLTGSIRTPGDKSISHRVLLIGALAGGTTRARGLSDGDDVARTEAAVVAMGATVDHGPAEVAISGGRDRLRAPGPVDCGNSGTTMRLLAGVTAGFDGQTVLTGDPSLSSRPMDRVVAPLRAMGAEIGGQGPQHRPPLHVRGAVLHGVSWTPPMASAQVKSAILFAGLDATGSTVVTEPIPTRAHTEELLAAAGAEISVEPFEGGRRITVGASRLSPLDLDVPGDPSQAAFWLVAACVVPGSSLRVEAVYAGRDRTGFLRVLERMGAAVDAGPERAGARDLEAAYGPLVATDVDAAEIPSLDEVPVLAVAAAAARGRTTFSHVGELRVKETDRLAATVALVRALGAEARAEGDDLVVVGAGALGPGAVRFDSGGDHRLAMAALVGALGSGSGGVVKGVEAIATSYPGFLDDLDRLAGPGAWENEDRSR